MATITVPDESRRKQVVVGSSPQTSFTFDWVIFDTATDIRVWNGATELVNGATFSVAGNSGTDGGFDGGTVTLTGTLSSGVSNTTVTIEGSTPYSRLSNLASTGPLDIDLLNKDLNRVITMLHQNIDTIKKSPRLADDTTLSLPVTFPAASASKVISWNASANALEATISTTDITTATTKAAEASASATAAATSATSASSSASTATTKASEASASATAAAASAASAAVTIASQATAEAGTDNGDLMTALRTKQAVDSYGVITADDVATSGANKILKLDGSGALPAISGANLTNLPASGGTVDLTASGAVTAGKTLILNANGTVSQIAATTVSEVIGSSYSPTNETATESGVIAYSTTADRFLIYAKSTISGSDIIRASVLDLDSSMAISETVAPTAVSGAQGGPYSLVYSSVHDRFLGHHQNTSPYYAGILTFSYSSSDGLDIDGITNVSTANRPYGSSAFVGASDATIAAHYPHTTSNISYAKFGTLTKGSDASGDSISLGSEFQPGVPTSSGQYGMYYATPIYFPVEDKMMWFIHAYHQSGVAYRPRLSHGTISGTGSSASYSEDGEDSWDDTEKFDTQGGTPYCSGINRAVWFDGKHLRTLGLQGGYSKSAAQTIQSSHPTYAGHAVAGIPGTDKVVLFAADSANSDRLSYWVVSVTTGAGANSDTFAVDGPHQISTDAVYYGVGAAYSPDVDGFLVRVRLNSAASKTYGVRVTRTSSNVSTSNFIGFASNSASDGGTVTVQLPSAVATPTQGSLTTGTTYYVKNDGTIDTTDAGYGIAGRAVSSTQLVVEERA